MNKNTFNLNRFGKYFIHDIDTQTKNIGMLWMICVLFPVISYAVHMLFGNILSSSDGLFYIWGNPDSAAKGIDGPAAGSRFAFFAVTAIVLAVVFPSRAYGGITEKKEGSAWLLLPASRLEKFISMLLVSLVLVPLTFFAGYLVCDWLVCLFDPSCGKPLLTFRINDLIPDDSPHLVANGFWILYSGTVSYVSLFLLGGLIFRKWKVAYTILSLFILNNVLVPVFAISLSGFDWFKFGMAMENWFASHASHLDLYVNLVINAMLAFVLLVCFIASWFRIKNRQH